MMKILALNASYRGERGQTQQLINHLFSGAREAGATCESIALAQEKIIRCTGCNTCQRSAHWIEGQNGTGGVYEMHCIYQGKDAAEEIFAKIAQANLLVYATPVYVFGMSTLLKMLFERMYGTSNCADLRVTKSGLMFHHVNQQITSKPFVPLICCDNLENATPHNTIAYFRTFSRFMDAPQVGLLVRNGGGLAQVQDEALQCGIQARIEQVHAAYHQAGIELAQTRRISRATQHKANQEILPLPLFGLLKQIHLRPLQEMFVEKANAQRTRHL